MRLPTEEISSALLVPKFPCRQRLRASTQTLAIHPKGRKRFIRLRYLLRSSARKAVADFSPAPSILRSDFACKQHCGAAVRPAIAEQAAGVED